MIENEANRTFQSEEIHPADRKELVISVDGRQLQIDWFLFLQKRNLISCYFKEPFTKFRMQIRLYRFCGKGTGNCWDMINREYNVSEWKGSMKITNLKPGYYFCELGIIVKGNRFFPVLRSNIKGYAKSGQETVNFPDITRMYAQEWRKFVSTYTFYNDCPEKQ